jgi:2-polyprenyl-6-methoxyphenol hydroxylase-like FAD-dependent oxidoreductase
LASIRDRSTKHAGMSVVDSGGKEIFRSTERTLTGGRFDSPDVEILRDELCLVLYEAVGDQVDYLFGDSVASIRQSEAGVDVAFVNAAPRRFDLVVGADGLHSVVRRLAFGPEEEFIRYLGGYLAVFAMPNFLGLDRWQVFHQHGNIFGGIMGLRPDADARTYIAFRAAEPADYDYRDVAAQKRLVADRVGGAGWELPRIVEHMWRTPDFHFDPTSQIRMDHWSSGRVVLVAGYCVSPATGQGTTVAMVGAYVLAGELAAHREDHAAGTAAYEAELRDYAGRNQDLAVRSTSRPRPALGEPAGAEATASPDGVPDYGQMVQPLTLKDY